MALSPDTPPNSPVRWVGEPIAGPIGEVKPGDQGTFIDFDGPLGTLT